MLYFVTILFSLSLMFLYQSACCMPCDNTALPWTRWWVADDITVVKILHLPPQNHLLTKTLTNVVFNESWDGHITQQNYFARSITFKLW